MSVRARDKGPLKTDTVSQLNPLLGMQGKAFMKLLETGIRVFTHAQGTAVRWLKEELAALNVKTPLSDGRLEEFARDADSAAWNVLAESEDGSYLTELRQQVREQASFVQLWTGTDDKIAADDASAQAFVRIARKYALPRPWKLSEPVAVETRRVRPLNWKWATAVEVRSVA